MDTTLSQLLDLFIATKSTEGKSAQTTDWYRKRLKHLMQYLGDEAGPSELNLQSARAFGASLQGREARYTDHPITPRQDGGLSEYTIHGYVRAMKAFGTWLHDEGFTRTNALERLKRPKLPQTVIEILTDEEIKTLFEAINLNCMLGSRMMLVGVLLLETGIRANELLTLTLENIDLLGDRMKVWGKGSKERIVPISPTAKKVIIRWQTAWRPQPADPKHDYLLPSMDGRPLSYTAMAHLIKRMGEKAGIPRLHAHLVRHTFAVKYLMNGGDVMTLRNILGHTSLTVTQSYMHLAQSHVQVRYNMFSPLENMDFRIGGRNGGPRCKREMQCP